jgi:hypothetical protein
MNKTLFQTIKPALKKLVENYPLSNEIDRLVNSYKKSDSDIVKFVLQKENTGKIESYFILVYRYVDDTYSIDIVDKIALSDLIIKIVNQL